MNGMYVVVGVLFILPTALLGAAWRSGLRLGEESSRPNWRSYSLYAALTVASCSTLAIVCFFVSWFHNGGSPHGLTPSPGVWKSLGRVFTWTLVTSILLAILRNRKSSNLSYWVGCRCCCFYGHGFHVGDGLIPAGSELLLQNRDFTISLTVPRSQFGSPPTKTRPSATGITIGYDSVRCTGGYLACPLWSDRRKHGM